MSEVTSGGEAAASRSEAEARSWNTTPAFYSGNKEGVTLVRPEEQPKYEGSFALLYKAKRDPPTFPEKNARAGEDPTTRRASFQTPLERGKTGEHDDEQSQGGKQSVPLL